MRMGCSGSVGRGPGPLRATRDRTPPNAPRDSWRCESIGSEHRRCQVIEAAFVGSSTACAMPGNDRPRTPGHSSGSSSAPSNGTNAETTTCVSSSRSSRSSGRNRRWRRARRWRHGRRGLYEPFHWALLGADGPFDLDRILVVARSVGLDAERFVRDMKGPALDALIGQNAVLANALGVRGTPAFVIGDGMIRGALPLEQFRAAIADARVAPEARGIGAAPTKAGSASSGPCRSRRRGRGRVVRGYDRGGSTMMRPRPRLSR